MNKIGSTRIIEINNNTKAKSGFPFIKDEFLSKACKLRLVISDDEVSKQLSDWDDSLISGDAKVKKTKYEKYDLVRRNPPFHDQLYAKLRLCYSDEEKKNINLVKTEILSNKKNIDELTLEKLNDLLSKSNKWKVTIRASSLYNWKNKKGISYMIDKIELF
jgi:hypothetical protein